jgi:hypothetical protein
VKEGEMNTRRPEERWRKMESRTRFKKERKIK